MGSKHLLCKCLNSYMSVENGYESKFRIFNPKAEADVEPKKQWSARSNYRP